MSTSPAVLFRQVRIVDRASELHGSLADLLLQNGRLSVDPARFPTDREEIEVDGLCVSPGFVDIGAGVGEPGFEQRETVLSLLDAAAVGGYTHVVAQPLTNPAADNQAIVRSIRAQAEGHPVALGVIGALSKGGHGTELAEYGDMALAGVRLVGDGLRPIADPKLLQLAIAYAQALDLTVTTTPGERRLAGGGQMYEGRVSTELGLPGIPALAELLGLKRDLGLLSYRGGRLHVQAVSLAESVALLRAEKGRSTGLTYGVPALNLLLTDEALRGFDVNAKVTPPLATEADRLALCEAILTEEADALISNHRPAEIEHKALEFPYADSGSATIELAFSIANQAVGKSEVVAAFLGRHNRRIAGLPEYRIADGAEADLTFFLPDIKFTAPNRLSSSLGANPPAPGHEVRGVVYAIARNEHLRRSKFASLLLDNP